VRIFLNLQATASWSESYGNNQAAVVWLVDYVGVTFALVVWVWAEQLESGALWAVLFLVLSPGVALPLYMIVRELRMRETREADEEEL